MGVHPSGDGAAWDSLEAIDVDQPHGLDYRTWQHLSKAVRKRLSQEHVTFADSTVGGIHKPGRSAVLEIRDGTPPGTRDGSYGGHGIAWDNTSRLWCWTALAGVTTAPGVAGTADWTLLQLHPDKQWGGKDITWAGAHEFDASVDISGNVAIDGDLSVDGTVNFGGDVHFGADISIDGTVDFASDVAFISDVSIDVSLAVGGDAKFYGDVSIDGTTVLQNTIIEGDVTFTFTAIAGETGPIFKILGDWSSRSQDTTYTARTDGMVYAYQSAQGIGGIKIQTPAGTTRMHQQGANSSDRTGISCFVKKGNTWCSVTDVTTVANTIFWLPFGDNT